MKSFRLLTCAVFAAATVPRLAHRGMFVDGVTYASIARNLAEGRGSFWTPFYTATVYPQFHDHPPLGFWLQSLWFRALGDHLYVERTYSLVMALATAAVIAAIWRKLYGTFEWLPILIWIAVPVVSWSIVGNLLETTVGLFVTIATLAVLRGTLAATFAAAAAWGVLSGASIVAAVLAKSPVGLFPLVAPLAFWFLPEARRPLATLAAQWIAVLGSAVALATIDLARSGLTEYVNVQIVAAIAGSREMSASSITIVKELVQGVMLPMAVVGIVAVAVTRRIVAPSEDHRRQALLFFLLGLAGTLPILVSAKQAGHYLVPAVPLFALAAAIALAPTIRVLAEHLSPVGSRWVSVLTVIVTLAAGGAALWPTLGRDRARLNNLDALDPAVPRGATIGICPEANSDWGLHAWFERRFSVSLDARQGRRHANFLKTAPERSGCPPAECVATTDSARELVMMQCPRPD